MTLSSRISYTLWESKKEKSSRMGQRAYLKIWWPKTYQHEEGNGHSISKAKGLQQGLTQGGLHWDRLSSYKERIKWQNRRTLSCPRSPITLPGGVSTKVFSVNRPE